MYPDDEIFTIAETLISLCENEEQKRGMDAMLDLFREYCSYFSYYTEGWGDMDEEEQDSFIRSFLPK